MFGILFTMDGHGVFLHALGRVLFTAIVASTIGLVTDVMRAADAAPTKPAKADSVVAIAAKREEALIDTALKTAEAGKFDAAYRLLAADLPKTKSEYADSSDNVAVAKRVVIVVTRLRNQGLYGDAEKMAKVLLQQERGAVMGRAKSPGRAAASFHHAWLAAKILGDADTAAEILESAASDDPEDQAIKKLKAQVTQRKKEFPSRKING